MTRRKILLLCGFLSLAAISLGFYVPQYFSPIPELGAEMRSLLEPMDEETSGGAEDEDRDQWILVDLRVLLVGPSELDGPLLANGKDEGRTVCGLVKDANRLDAVVEKLEREGCLEIVSRPKACSQSHEVSRCEIGQIVPVIENGVQTGTVLCGISAEVRPAMRADGSIHLRLTTKYSSGAEPNRISELTGAVIVRPGQTCFFGGVKHKTIGTVTTRIPLLSELPWIGSCFVRDHKIELDEELLVLATVRSVE